MTTDPLYRPSHIRPLLERHGFKNAKSLGQNFLLDKNIVEGIVRATGLDGNDVVLEVGTGIGTLTHALADSAERVFAIEIDRRLEPVLEETLADYSNIDILFEDVLNVDLKEELNRRFPGRKVKVAANLPYYVTTPILSRFLEEDLPVESLTVMVQKEVGERMLASPGTKAYGTLSLFVQFFSRGEIVMNVPRTVFFPSPDVDSVVVHLDLEKKFPQADHRAFREVVKAAFSKRRKTLLNALSSYGSGRDKEQVRKILENVGIDERRRGETLTIEEFITLSESW